MCPEREIVLRSGDRVTSIRLSRRAQWLTLGLLIVALAGAGAAGLSMIAASAAVAQDRARLTAQGEAVADEARKVNAYKQSIDSRARELEARQDFIDDLYRTHFGDEKGDAGGAGLIGATLDKSEDDTRRDLRRDARPTAKTSIGPDTASLLDVDLRQRRFARLLTAAVRQRADKAAAAIRGFGLNPDALTRTGARGQGGPFVPWRGGRARLPVELEKLASALARMEFLERSLVAIPSGLPTVAPMESSSYGYRRDPFNGHPAFHAGIDFPGRHGQPILSAAHGKVAYVGQRQGYGNVVEVDHGHGLMTRYAHLSGFSARTGQVLARGDALGRMGSTGRSTGTHLHFEVRLNDRAINPRRFLEAARDILHVQQIAKDRFADLGNRG
ncbi:MAG: M23 family metallopeptidase [Sphingobium sp.]